MGFFSKLTCDTFESIPNNYVAKPKPVYLLQPNGKPPIKESEYSGYGIIGGIDWFEWLVAINAEHLNLNVEALTLDEIRNIGISLDCGTCFIDQETSQIWCVFHDGRNALYGHSVNFFEGLYSEVIPELGLSANELAQSGRFQQKSIRELSPAKHYIKLSHNKDAAYEDHLASEDCPYQGYFYPEEMIHTGNFHVPEPERLRRAL